MPIACQARTVLRRSAPVPAWELEHVGGRVATETALAKRDSSTEIDRWSQAARCGTRRQAA